MFGSASGAASVAASAGSQVERDVLSFDDVTFGFPGHAPAIRDVSFRVSQAQFVAVIGPSGCGKSTILNLSAGLLRPLRGEVQFAGEPIERINTEAAYVTQDANLLPWLTVRGNIELALKFRGVAKSERRNQVDHWTELVGLGGFTEHYPRELSGGMQKRCAIARALVYEPSIVLMDEPFGPLDAMLRLRLQQQLLDIWEAQSGTVVFVTHDLMEAICLADQVIVMSRGPGTVRSIVPVPIERPRDIVQVIESPEYSELYRELWDVVKAELGPRPAEASR